MSMNIVLLTGRLGQDPKIRIFPNGDRVATLRLATRKMRRNAQTGTIEEGVEWHNVRHYGPGEKGVVDRIQKIARKGSLIQIRGELTYATITAEDGTKKQLTFIECRGHESFSFLAQPTPPATTSGGEREKPVGYTELGPAELSIELEDPDPLGLIPLDEI